MKYYAYKVKGKIVAVMRNDKIGNVTCLFTKSKQWTKGEWYGLIPEDNDKGVKVKEIKEADAVLHML